MAKLVHVEQDGTGIKRRRVESPGISMEMVLSRCHDVFDCFDQSIIVSDMSQESPSIVYVNPFARSVFGIPSGNDRFPFAEFANGLKRCTSSISSPICSCESFTGVHKASGVDLKLHSSPFLVDSIKCGRIWRIEEMCHVEEFNAHQLLKQRTQEILELKKQKMEDILERKKLEEELKVVSAVAQKTDTGVIITDKRRKVIWINEAFVKSTGYTLKEMYGKSPGSVLQCEQSDPEVIEKMRDCLDSAREFCVDIVNRRKNGMLMMFNIDVFPVFDDDGELLHFVALQREVSDKALREKKSSAVEQAKANALANQLKVDFMMKMSHELRTPLNGILGMTSSLLHSKLDDPAEIRSGLETIFVSGNHLLTLINNIIDLSKIRSGKMLLEEDSTDIPSTIKEAIDACRSLSEEKKIKICSFYEETLPRFVVCDSLKVRQILINLIGNAIKFSRPGEQITVSVTLDRDEKRTSVPFKPSDDNPSESSRIHILFTVTDSGPGIRKELLHNVFGSFVQLDRSHETMVRYGSSGLGLHISRELASIMNGTIWIQSSILDVGSTFAFSIPVIPCDNGASSVTRTQNHVTELEPALDRIRKKYFNYKVLIVEDNLINQKVIFKLLSRFGFSLEVANNGKDALKMIEDAQFQNDGFDLVMMDVQMPVMDGLTASKTIVEKFGNSRPKICALTANVMKQEMATCLKSGMDYYLSKPVTVSKLYNFFISVLEDPEIVIELSPTPNLPNPHLRSLDSPSPRPKNPSSSTSE